MASNPRRRSGTATATPTEEVSEVTAVTTTDQEPVVAPPADAVPAAPTAETPAPAAGASDAKPDVDHEGNLFNAIQTFVSDHNVEALQTAYRQVPTAARGKVQGLAMKRALTNGVSMDDLGQVLDAFSNLPAAASKARVKVELDPKVEAAIRLNAFMTAFDRLRTDLGDEAFTAADAWYNTSVPEEHKVHVEGVVNQLVSASVVKSSGPRGPRKTFKQSFAEVVKSGAIPVGATLTGSGDVTATVTAEGKIQTADGKVYDAPSAAAKAVHTTKDGKETASNGWAFWQYDGKDIGTYRSE